MIRLGWKAGVEQYPPTEILEYAVAAEEAGFDLIDVSDHFQPWSEAGQAPFTWTWLGALAVRTHRISLGAGTTCPLLRYHPAIVAQAAATLSHFAPGRTYLCVGTGEAINEYAATGRWPGYKERQARLVEAIDLIRLLWTGEEITYQGTFYQTRKARLYTPPAAPIPLYVSTLVPSSAAFAGHYGDGLITIGGKEPDLYRQLLERFEQGARDAGQDPARMPRLVELGVAYTADTQTAIAERKKYWAGSMVPAAYNQKLYTPALVEQNGQLVGSETIQKAACISPRAEDHVRFTQQYIDLGFDHIIVHTAGPDQHAFIQEYGRDVLPHLRQ
jgi:coenzyme F420-dependent glucose-6-phosphate dehydrogenase